MKTTYLLTTDNDIQVFPSRKEAETAADQCGDDCHGFDSAETLEGVLASCGADRAVEIWNSLPGVEPLKSFKSKAIAAGRIFQQLRSSLAGETVDADEPEPVAKPKKSKREPKPKAERKPRKSAKKAKKAKTATQDLMKTERSPRKSKRAKAAKPASGDSKKAQVIEMISKKGGTTLDAIMQATGWMRHGVRGFVSVLKSKHGINIESYKNEAGERAYRVA